MGLVAVKDLLEEGFHVTGFERSAYVGGLWHFTEDKDTLSVLECLFSPFCVVILVLMHCSDAGQRLHR